MDHRGGAMDVVVVPYASRGSTTPEGALCSSQYEKTSECRRRGGESSSCVEGKEMHSV